MTIINYRKYNDIDVYFSEYNYIFRGTTYDRFKKGRIQCPYEPRTWGKGYLGVGEYRKTINDIKTEQYNYWRMMLERCYSEKYHIKHPTYQECIVCEEWLDFQNFARWYDNNYYQVDNETMCLDKDILNKGNKIYSPNTCVFVPERINALFTKCDKTRGDYPIGVYYNKTANKYIAKCSTINGRKHLGCFETPNDAFIVYKNFKERYVKQMAFEYQEKIPNKLFNALYNYEVDVDD